MALVYLKPRRFDFICGRGDFTNKHFGNQRIRKMVKNLYPAYVNRTRRNGKAAFIREFVIAALQEQNVRFLSMERKKNRNGRGYSYRFYVMQPRDVVTVFSQKFRDEKRCRLTEGLDDTPFDIDHLSYLDDYACEV